MHSEVYHGGFSRYAQCILEVMMTRHTRGKITWIDLESPSPDELHQVMTEFSISSSIEDQIIAPTPYPLVISFPTYSYLILHFPVTSATGGARNQEIDFIVGKRFIITVRYEVVDSIINLHKVFEAEDLLGLSATSSESEEYLVEHIFRRLYHAIREQLEATERQLERIELDIFSGKERATVRTISDVGRILLRFEMILRRNAEPLIVFLEELKRPGFFGPKFEKHAVNIKAELDHVAGIVASFRDVATELRITNDSLLSSSQNQVMKTLTVVTFIMFPLSIVPAIFAVDTGPNSILHHPDFIAAIFGLMGIIAISLFVLSKFRRWF